MNIPHINRKPVVITLGIFLGIILVHLAGIYLYEGGKYMGLPGGSISIGVMGKTPDVMNPLNYGISDADDLMFRFLFRGLIRYNPGEQTLQGDLANCDITQLSKVTCKVKNGEKWSDGTMVQNGDVIASIEAFRNNAQNAKMAKFLNGLSVSTKNGELIFSSKEKNPLMIEILTYPIIRSDMIEQIQTKRFSSGNYITSGMYTFGETLSDTDYGFDRITLVNNPNYSGQRAWLDKIHFKFFPDLPSLERSTETLGVIIPPVKQEKLAFSARFDAYQYTTFEFFGIFFQTDRIPKSLRNALHWQIGMSFSGNIIENHKAVKNIFSGGETILPQGNLGNFPDILRKMGYRKKDEILAEVDAVPTTVTGTVEYEKPQFFLNKMHSLVLFSDNATGGILLSGKVPRGTESVSINGYALQEFHNGDTTFVYRVSQENETLHEGKNTYTLLLGPHDFTGETLTLYYSSNPDTLSQYRNEIDAEYIARLNTPALIAERERKKTEKRVFIEGLDDHYYYNEKNEPFHLDVAYIQGVQSTEEYAHVIENSLKHLGIIPKLIPVEIKDLEHIIQSGEKNYDILIAGVSTSGNIAELGQLFDSSEAGKGVNFSNIESKSLDELFLELRSNTLPAKVQEIEKQILTIMQDESFFFPLSQPVHVFYLDRNLKGVKTISTIPGIEHLFDIFQYASIRDSYTLETDGKGPINFFTWIFRKAF